jgi:hypothetical protein
MGEARLVALNFRKELGGGETLPHVFECSDGRDWVVKLPGNPHGVSGLCGDWIGTVLASTLGIHMPEASPVIVSQAALSTLPVGRPASDWATPGVGYATVYMDTYDVTSVEQIISASSESARADRCGRHLAGRARPTETGRKRMEPAHRRFNTPAALAVH